METIETILRAPGVQGLLMLLLFALFCVASVTLGSPANRRKAAAWLIASARAQEELREARRQIRESELRHRERVAAAMMREGEFFVQSLREREKAVNWSSK